MCCRGNCWWVNAGCFHLAVGVISDSYMMRVMIVCSDGALESECFFFSFSLLHLNYYSFCFHSLPYDYLFTVIAVRICSKK